MNTGTQVPAQSLLGEWAVQVGGELRWLTVGTYDTAAKAEEARDALLKSGYSENEVRTKLINN